MRWISAASALALACVLSLGLPPRAAARDRTPAAATLSCRPLAGVDSVLAPGATILLGEMHGNEESPSFAGDLACAALARGLAVEIAFELPADEAPLVAAVVASTSEANAARARAALLAGAFWSKPYQDGRSSAARLALLTRMAGWRRDGHAIAVASFDRGTPAGTPAAAEGAAREQTMADALGEGIRSSPQALWIVLVGNVHSRVTAGVPWDAAYEPMGLRLARLVPARRTWALDVRYRDGASWTCETAEPRSCGVRPFRGDAAALVDGLPRVTLFPSRREGHDGVYDVGPLHPSRPAAAQPPPAGAPGGG